MSVRAILLWLVTATGALAQGFAGLGTEAEGFRLPDPSYQFSFPADHGPHPGFRIEWWYLTANLRDADGRDYGVQWTLFRSALSPEDDPPLVWMGHAALTTPDAHYAAERFARGGTGQAGAQPEPFAAWIDEWQLTGPDEGRVTARGPQFSYDLALSVHGPIVPQGNQGFSVKSQEGQASHYYSQPYYQVSGTLDLTAGPIEVSGQAWLDREWSSQPLSSDQTGWDWVSLHLGSGAKLMAFRLRGAKDYTTGTWITPGGVPEPLTPGASQLTPLSETDIGGRQVPTRWRLQIPERGLDIEVGALNPAAWMDLTVAYWEGPVRATGSHSGVGYLEMTGYE